MPKTFLTTGWDLIFQTLHFQTLTQLLVASTCIRNQLRSRAWKPCGERRPGPPTDRPALPPLSSTALNPPCSAHQLVWDGWLEGRRRLADPAIQGSRTSRADCRTSEGGGSGTLGSSLSLIVWPTHFRINAIKYGIFFLLFFVKFLLHDISV